MTTTGKRLGLPVLVVAGPFGAAQTGTTFAAIEIPAKTFIPPYGVSVIVTTVLAGGTPSLDVGDTDDDAWVDTTEITEDAAGTYAGVAAAKAVTGHYYAAADTLDVVMAASTTSGAFYVTCLMYDVSAVI